MRDDSLKQSGHLFLCLLCVGGVYNQTFVEADKFTMYIQNEYPKNGRSILRDFLDVI